MSGYRKLGYREQVVGGLAHGGHHYDRPAVQPALHNSGDALDGRGGLDRGTAEFHDDHDWAVMFGRSRSRESARSIHQSSSPSEYISSAFKTAAPAAPRMVLWPKAMNL